MEVRRKAVELRPLGVGEILDAGFKIYKARFRTLILCVLAPVVLFVALDLLLRASVIDDAFDPAASRGAQAGTELAALLASGVISSVLSLLALAACTRAVAGAYLGEDVDWRHSIRFALVRLLPLVAALIVTLLAGTVGLILLVIPGIYVLVRLAVVVPALLMEDRGAAGAVKRSWELVKGRWWPTFAVVVITLLLVGIISAILQGLVVAPILAGADSELVGALLTGLGQIVANVFTLPLQAAVITILYFDLRVRKEGLDLQLLAGDLGRPAASPGGGSAGSGESPGYHGFAPPSADGGSSEAAGEDASAAEERGRR
jgi:hypothetical protein